MAGARIHHPRAIELEAFLLGQLPPREAASVIAHLLTGCASCRKQMEPLAGVVLTPNLIPDEPVEVGSEYDFPLFRAFAAARRYTTSLARERREAERDREDPPLREVPLPEVPGVGSPTDWERCEQILARCRELRQGGPAARVAAASLAVSLAERLSPDLRGPCQLADLQARAWAERGNARRVTDDLIGAESDLTTALERAREGTEDPRLLARLLDLTASLRIDQRRLTEAAQLLDWVYAIHLALGEHHEAGRTLISKSNAAAYALDLKTAVRLLSEGLALIDAERDPKLVLATVHNLLSHLVDDGQIAEAERLFRESHALYSAHGGLLDRLKGRWLEGRIASGLSDPAEAERSFQEVRSGFAHAGIPYDMALVSLDLAALWLEQGRTREIQTLLGETVAIFEARGIRREAIAGLLMLQEAIERDRASASLLRAVASELQRLAGEPVSKAS
ncbi:MAG: MalT-like region [Acidobacteriota bacterium]|nr:MalT-like region [Acidobacteriota bacterium]